MVERDRRIFTRFSANLPSQQKIHKVAGRPKLIGLTRLSSTFHPRFEVDWWQKARNMGGGGNTAVKCLEEQVNVLIINSFCLPMKDHFILLYMERSKYCSLL